MDSGNDVFDVPDDHVVKSVQPVKCLAIIWSVEVFSGMLPFADAAKDRK